MIFTLFWILISLSITAIAVNMFFFEILEIIIILLFFDFLMLILMIFYERRDTDNVQDYILMKLDTIEKTCELILKKVFTPETTERLKRNEKEIVKWLENF